MAKGKSTWKYNKLLTSRRNYFAPGGNIPIGSTFTQFTAPTVDAGLDKLASIKSNIPNSSWVDRTIGNVSGAISSIRSSGLGGITTAIGGAVGNAISGGLSSGAGNLIEGLGNIAGMIPGAGVWAGPALKVVSGITNALFGSKVNQANVDAANADINRMNSVVADASDFDALGLKIGSTVGRTIHNKSFYGKDGLFSNKVSKLRNQMEERARIASLRQDQALLDNAEELNINQLRNLEANYSAFGGPLGFDNGAIGFEFMDRYITAKEDAAKGKDDKLTSLPNSLAKGGSIHIKPENRGKFTATKKRTGKSTEELTHSKNPITRKRAIFAQNAKKWHHAFGGELNTQGADFTNGMVFIGNGGSHESNPFEGVPMGVDNEGTPNLVEEGETIFNDYVFSKRLTVPKAIRNKYKLRGPKNLSFADASKELAKESEERPNDPISLKGLQAIMGDLANAQEALKAENQDNQFANGGKVNKFDGNSTMSNMIRRNSSASQGDYWNALMGSQLLSRLQTLNALSGDERETAINDFVTQANNLQDSYYNDIYNSGATWGGRALAGKGASHQTAWNNAGYNNYTNYGDWFGARNHTGDRADTWVDNNIGDLTLLRNLGDSRYLSEAQARQIRDLSSRLGLTYDEKGNGNTLMYFNRATAPTTATKEPVTPVEDKPVEEGVKKEPYTSDYKPENIYLGRNRAEPLRYAPAVGFGIGALTDLLGLTNRPDYSSADAILEATRGGGTYQPVRFKPIGNYLAYNPFDRDYYINKLNAESGATRRALLQNAGLNRGAGMAAILAADNNAMNQLGNLARQAEEYNLAQRQQVEDFNRGTNMTNSQGFLQADIANQKAQAEAREFGMKGIMTAAQMRAAAKQASDAARSANLSGLFQTLGDIGYEAKNDNMVRRALELDLWGPGGYRAYMDTKKSRGGKLKRKRKGLTF